MHPRKSYHHTPGMKLDLTDAEAEVSSRSLPASSRAPVIASPRIRTLRAVLDRLRPEPVREPLPPECDGVVKRNPSQRPPMTLGSAAKAELRLIV